MPPPTLIKKSLDFVNKDVEFKEDCANDRSIFSLKNINKKPLKDNRKKKNKAHIEILINVTE